DQGTTITISLPRGSEHLPRERIGADRKLPSLHIGAQPFIDEALGWVSSTRVDPKAGNPISYEHLPGQPVAHSKGAERILVVDDNSDMRTYLCRLLEHRYVVDTVPDGPA